MLSEKLRKYQNHRVKSDALHIFSPPHELLSSSVGLVVRASASRPANVGLIPSLVKPMTLCSAVPFLRRAVLPVWNLSYLLRLEHRVTTQRTMNVVKFDAKYRVK